MGVRSGDRNTQVVIESPPTAVDAQGWPDHEDGDYVEFATRWAHVRPMSGRELDAANAVQADVDTEIVLPWDSRTKELTPRHRCRLRDGSRVWNVVAVLNPDFRNREIRVRAKEKVS